MGLGTSGSARLTARSKRLNPAPRVPGLSSAEQGEDLAVVGESPQSLLGEQQVAVDGDLEHAAMTGGQLAVDTQCFVQLGRQTGGPGFVVSLGAVLDLDPHAHLHLSS